MLKQFQNEILKLKKYPYVKKKIIQQFLERLHAGSLIQELNPIDHYCSFFVPFDMKSKSIFVGHHIKADEWIPPGGHIELEETPLQAVYREFSEELRFPLSDQKVELFDLGLTRITDSKRSCRIHYDFWYLVFVEKVDFNFDKDEFYEAVWLSVETAIKKAERQSIVIPLTHLSKNLVALRRRGRKGHSKETLPITLIGLRSIYNS